MLFPSLLRFRHFYGSSDIMVKIKNDILLQIGKRFSKIFSLVLMESLPDQCLGLRTLSISKVVEIDTNLLSKIVPNHFGS